MSDKDIPKQPPSKPVPGDRLAEDRGLPPVNKTPPLPPVKPPKPAK